MLRIYRFCCLALLLLAGPALAQTPVEWSFQVQGDLLTLDAKTKAAQPAQRASSSPAFLEVSFPKAKLAGSAISKAVDKGLIQKVQTAQDGENVVLRVFVLTKPRANLTKTSTGYRYTIRMSEPATASTAAKPAASKPAAKPPAAPPPAASKPQESTAPASPPRVVTAPTVETAPPAPTAGGRNPRTPISVVFKDKPLAEAISEMASRAGYTAQLDPKLSGVVNLSLSEVPFEEALQALLQPYGDAVSADIGSTSITVSKTSTAATSAQPSTPTGPVVLEYYPFSTKDAKKMMDAAMKAIPELSYRVDPVLNILLVQGPREDVVRLGELLKPMFNK